MQKSERMNPHTPKGTPTLGVGALINFWIFRKWLQESKLIGLKCSLYHWKALGAQMSEMGLHDSFGHLKHKLWSKEGLGVKLANWLSITKSRESPRFPYSQVACHILWESSRQATTLLQTSF
jgi:hypothetical protein